jgi:hypothetical protein
MLTVHCPKKFEIPNLAGSKLEESDVDTIVGGDEPVDILRPDGGVIARYRPGWFSPELCAQVLPAARKAAKPTTNRGMAAGALSVSDVEDKNVGKLSKTRFREVKKDGTVSNTNRAIEVSSGVVGYFDRNARFPYCRQTSYMVSEAASWKLFLPFIKRADEGFREFMPERWAAQRDYVLRTAPDYVIPESTFTTVSVNRNFRTAVHKDAGDLDAGFGVMACIRNELFDGSFLCFPEYRVALRQTHGALTLADVHQWHGNTPFKKMRAGYERLCFVFYYRQNMVHCLPMEQELERVKRRQRGSKINE